MSCRLTNQSTPDTRTMGSAADMPTLDRLVREHLPSALRFVTRLTGDLDTAEEVVQEALLRATRGWTTFRGQSQFRTWLFRIVVNTFHDHCGERRTVEALPAELADHGADDPSAVAMAGELGARIAHLVSSLPPRQRVVLVMTTYEGLTPHEIADNWLLSACWARSAPGDRFGCCSRWPSGPRHVQAPFLASPVWRIRLPSHGCNFKPSIDRRLT